MKSNDKLSLLFLPEKSKLDKKKARTRFFKIVELPLFLSWWQVQQTTETTYKNNARHTI